MHCRSRHVPSAKVPENDQSLLSAPRFRQVECLFSAILAKGLELQNPPFTNAR